MKKYTCLAFARHDGCDKNFLFCVEPAFDLKNGQRILVDTVKGEQSATMIGDSFMVDERALKSIMLATGAYLPIKRVLGTEKRIKVEQTVVSRFYDLPW